MPEGAGARRGALLRSCVAGFTLLEVLIALAIAALALGALFETGVTDLRATHAAAKMERAISLGRSRLALAARSVPLAPGDWQGDEGSGFHWHLRVTAAGIIPQASLPGRETSPLVLYDINVSMVWQEAGERHGVQLQTARLERISQ